MIQALESQMQMPEALELPFDDRFGILVDAEVTARDNQRLQNRLKSAHLRQSACLEDLNFKVPRGLDRALLSTLATSQWVAKHRNILIEGPTGSGKSFIACALAQKAIRDGYTAIYERASNLFHALSLARATGKYSKHLDSIARIDVVVFDDFGLTALTDEQRHDFLEIVEARYERRSTVIAGQLPINKWHQAIGEPTIADAILDRLVHNAHKISINSKESMRSPKNKGEEKSTKT
jgi:DNA replication protein DnaC